MRKITALLALLVSTASVAQPRAGDTVMPWSGQFGAPADPIAYSIRLGEARQALDAGQLENAEVLYRRLTAEYGLDRQSWTGLGSASRELGKHEQAIRAYQRSIELIGPVPGGARYWTAVSQVARGDTEAALDTLETLVFQDAWIDRPGLHHDEAFAALRDHPRMRRITGYEDVTRLDRTGGWRHDLAHLVSEIRRLSPDHRGRALPAEAESIRRQLHEDIPHLTDEQVFARMAQLLASLKQGHTMMWGYGPGKPQADSWIAFSWLPLKFHAFPEGVFVVGADAAHADLVGLQLLELGGLPVGEAVRRVASATAVESPMEWAWSVPPRLADVPLLKGLGFQQAQDGTIALRLRARDGSRLERRIAPVMDNPRAKLRAPPGVAPPLWLRDVQQSHWYEPMPAHGALYVQLNQMAPDPDETLPQFGIRLRSVLAESGARNLLLDLRHNNGGDTFTYTELLRTIVGFSTQEGHRLYVLTGRDVYSAAANLLTELERLADPVLVGEPTSMSGNQHGDEGSVRLPWSGLRGTIAGVLWQRSHPWDGRRSIPPRVPVTTTAEAYFQGRDPVLETVQRMMAGNRGP